MVGRTCDHVAGGRRQRADLGHHRLVAGKLAHFLIDRLAANRGASGRIDRQDDALHCRRFADRLQPFDQFLVFGDGAFDLDLGDMIDRLAGEIVTIDPCRKGDQRRRQNHKRGHAPERQLAAQAAAVDQVVGSHCHCQPHNRWEMTFLKQASMRGYRFLMVAIPAMDVHGNLTKN